MFLWPTRSAIRSEVFVYHDSEDRLVATTETPKLREGEAGFLRVVDKNLHGAFLDWGLAGKDLFLPNRNQQGRRVGRTELPGLPVCRFGNGALRGDHEIQKLRQ